VPTHANYCDCTRGFRLRHTPVETKIAAAETKKGHLQNSGIYYLQLGKGQEGGLGAAGADAVVLDTWQYYVELVPMKLGMPYVHVSNALHFDYTGQTPLCFYDWPHETSQAALARNCKGVEYFAEFLARASAVIRGYAEHAGLKVDWANPYATISKLAWLSQTPKEFDFPSSHLPPQFHHTGPFHDGTGRIDADFPWEQLTGEPVIYASMGTVQNGLANVFRTITAALAPHQGVQLVLSVGNHLDPEEIGPVPSNTIIVSRAPQLELLFVPLKELTALHLSRLVDEVLKNPIYRDKALNFQKIIAETNGLSAAADRLEQAFGLNQKASEDWAILESHFEG